MKKALKIAVLAAALLVLAVVLAVVVFGERIQRYEVRQTAERLCDGRPAPPACLAQLAERFDGCYPALQRKEVDGQGFAACLGVEVKLPGPAKVQTGCLGKDLKVRIELFAGQETEGPDLVSMPFDGRRVYLAALPAVDTSAVVRVDLEKEPDMPAALKIALTPAGREAVATLTGANVGRFIGIVVDGRLATFPKVMGRVEADHLSLALAGKTTIADFCKPDT